MRTVSYCQVFQELSYFYSWYLKKQIDWNTIILSELIHHTPPWNDKSKHRQLFINIYSRD